MSTFRNVKLSFFFYNAFYYQCILYLEAIVSITAYIHVWIWITNPHMDLSVNFGQSYLLLLLISKQLIGQWFVCICNIITCQLCVILQSFELNSNHFICPHVILYRNHTFSAVIFPILYWEMLGRNKDMFCSVLLCMFTPKPTTTKNSLKESNDNTWYWVIIKELYKDRITFWLFYNSCSYITKITQILNLAAHFLSMASSYGS
jgi:hypothetical protein